jgi:hypothetical protein
MIVFAAAGGEPPAALPAPGIGPGPAGLSVFAPQKTQCIAESGISFVQLEHFFTRPPFSDTCSGKTLGTPRL